MLYREKYILCPLGNHVNLLPFPPVVSVGALSKQYYFQQTLSPAGQSRSAVPHLKHHIMVAWARPAPAAPSWCFSLEGCQ